MSNESVLKSVNRAAATLGKLPELAPTFDVIHHPGLESDLKLEPLRYIKTTYLGYLHLVRSLAKLSPEDELLISKANKLCAERGIGSNSAAHGGADHFLNTIGPENKKSLLQFGLEAANFKSPIFNEALADLDDRMTRGHELSVQGKTLADGDPSADKVIWGHTKGLQTRAMVHFVMCHFLERAMTQVFAHQESPDVQAMAAHKDFFLNALGDVIKLQAARGEIDPEIYMMWSSPREQGGLQWSRDEKQKVFNEVIERKNT